MSARSKNLERAEALAGAPIRGFLLGSRIHPLASILPVLVFTLGILTGSLVIMLPTSALLLVSLYLLLGRAVAITDDELVVLLNRPPLWRPAKVRDRFERDEVVVRRKRRLWLVDLGSETYYVNRTFRSELELLGADTSEGRAGRRRKPTPTRPTIESRRVTPKGTPPRGRRKKR